MSAVVLVGESWKPNIVQLLPYSNGNIPSNSDLKEEVKGVNGKRCFPILAVTRSQSGSTADDSAVSLETYSSLAFSDYKSEVSDSTPFSDSSSIISTKKDTRFRKITRHSSMRERRSEIMVKFAVQDLNEQSGTMTPRRNSVTSTDTGVSMTTTSAVSVSSNGLPKPTLSDKKYLYKQNGYKKTLALTPGEIELQKQRDKYIKEQSQKSKMYKLNINQLPRSNTPITDHDPDKLNMKQVIRFLQKQKPVVTPRAVKRENRSPERRSVECVPKTAPSHFMVGDKIRSDLKTSDSMRSRSSEINIASRSKLLSRSSEPPSRYVSQSSRYHHSQKSGDISKSSSFANGNQEETNDKTDRSSRDHKKERERSKTSRKRSKEFKLHRFLALAPNGEGQNSNPLIISNLAKVRTNNWMSVRDVKDDIKSQSRGHVRSTTEDRSCIRRVSSEKPTVAHYRALKRENTNLKNDRSEDRQKDTTQYRPSSESDRNNKNKSASPTQKMIRFQKVTTNDNSSILDSEDGFLSASSSSMIRLPSVHDYVEEEDDDTLMHDSSKSDPERRSPIQNLESEMELKRETNFSRTSADTSRCSFYSMPLLSSSSSPRRNVKSKQSIHISLPKEENNKEIRISLRQEKDLPARHTYMSDIAPRSSSDTQRSNAKDINDNITSSSGDSLNDKSVVRVSRISMHSGKTQDCGICDDTRMSPDSNVISSSVGALTSV